MSAVSGAAEGHLSILWAGGCYGCGCSHVGLWIFPQVWQFVGWICHYPSEAGVSRGGVKIPSQFGFLYLYEFSLQVWTHHAGSVSGVFLVVKAEIHV